MRRTLITLFIIFLASVSCLNSAAAQNETEMLMANDEEEIIEKNEKEVLAEEEGNFNISFNDGYNGYCIDYGKHDAKPGDSFTAEDTSNIINKNTGENVGNYLKTYFVEYYEDAMRDKIVTQHTIWHFTDDFNGWRLDYGLIENIKTSSSAKEIPDHGAVKKINDTTEAVFDFEMLKTGESENQNFFAYKITYRDIMNEIIKPSMKPSLESDMVKNPTSPISNESENENATISKSNESKDSENATISKSNATLTGNSNISPLKTSENDNDEITPNTEYGGDGSQRNDKINLSKHVTGNGRIVGISMFILLLLIVMAKYFRDDY